MINLESEENLKEIYPPELVSKKKIPQNLKALFFDLDINVKNRELETELYDKRDEFPVSIVKMPYHNSNMPWNVLCRSWAIIFYALQENRILKRSFRN